MNKQQGKAQKVLRTLAAKMIDRDTYEWPPKCSFITYQPQRPAREASAGTQKSGTK